ncbi:MAG: hypothetical protein IKW28_02430 [Lachnospiraceae bacterium]|nr:hypothetical protein [Lachnospiraceae bacterium]
MEEGDEWPLEFHCGETQLSEAEYYHKLQNIFDVNQATIIEFPYDLTKVKSKLVEFLRSEKGTIEEKEEVSRFS